MRSTLYHRSPTVPFARYGRRIDEAPLRGLIGPLLTPFDDDRSIAADLLVEHAHRLLDEGCIGLAPFGTTGEARSLGLAERRQGLSDIVGSGIDPTRLLVGTGLDDLPGTIELSAHAMDLGCRAVMVLPPAFYKSPSDDGVAAYFADLIERLGPMARIVLYHIPQVAGVGFGPALVARLKHRHPDQIVGIKDSSGDWHHTAALFDIADETGLAVYPGAEIPLPEALARGGPGCISATANTNAPAIVDTIDRHRAGDPSASAVHESVVAYRRVIERFAPIPAQKHLLVERTADRRWANVRPPWTPLDEQQGQALDAELAQR